MPATTPKSWVMSTMADLVRSLIRCNTSRTCAWMVTSRAVVGSSAISTSGSLEIAIAIMALCRIPPDSSWGYWSTRAAGLGTPTSSSRSIARSRFVALLILGWWTAIASSIW